MSIRLFITMMIIVATITQGNAQQWADDVIENVRKELAPDKRQTIYEVKASPASGGRVRLTGKMSDSTIHDVLLSELQSKGKGKIIDEIKLLPDTLWGQICISVACMRTSGKYSAELATQAIMGMPVRLLEEKDGWWRLQTPDGYLGWVWHASIAPKTAAQLDQWRQSPRLVVTSHHQIPAYMDAITTSPRDMITDLVPSAIVEGTLDDVVNGRVEVTLPDGRKAWAEARYLMPIQQWASQDFNPDVILDQAYALEGAPYLWGGTSAKATDCSGLVKVSYLANGIILRRDASQQALIGTHLEPEDWPNYQAGDLMFFGEKPGGRVTHVAIYDVDGWFIHCAGRVHRNSIDPESPDYVNRTFFGGSRIQGNEGTPGITYVRDHPWYFNSDR